MTDIEAVVETILDEYPDTTLENIDEPILGFNERQMYVDFRSNGHYFAVVREEHGLAVERTMGLENPDYEQAHRVWFTEMEVDNAD